MSEYGRAHRKVRDALLTVPPTEWTNAEWSRACELTGMSASEIAEVIDGLDERERDVTAALIAVDWHRVGAAMGDAVKGVFAQGLGLSDESKEECE